MTTLSPGNHAIRLLLLLAITIGLLACEKEELVSYSLSGKAQKGPFISGTEITIDELNSSLKETGRTLLTTVSSDEGVFSLTDFELESSYTLLTATGFHFSEIYGRKAYSYLSLQAISNLEEKESVNINAMTHLIKERIVTLVSDGFSFSKAKQQAEKEWLDFMGVSGLESYGFEDLDISKQGDPHAVLLAMSVMLQRYTPISSEWGGLSSQTSNLMSHLGKDLSDNGKIDNQDLIDAILFNISQLHLIDTRRNVESKYVSIDPSVKISDFESFISRFQETHSEFLYESIVYPESASPSPVTHPETQLPNLLIPADTIYNSREFLSLAAIVPINSSLTVKLIGDNSRDNYEIGEQASGWELIDNYPYGFTLNSQRNNNLMTFSIYLNRPGNAIVEYYLDDSPTPSFSKRISWAQSEL